MENSVQVFQQRFPLYDNDIEIIHSQGTRPYSSPTLYSARCWASFVVGITLNAPLALLTRFEKGGLYYKTNDTIAGFQSRVGCLFFLVSVHPCHEILC